jgi:nucleoside-diphosphate-sugar epimerase
MRILVTGITGFIGARWSRFLSAEDEVVVLARTPDKVKGLKGASVISVDLNDTTGLADKLRAIAPEACIHLAWEGIPDYGYAMSRRNLEQGTALLRVLVEEAGCRKIVMGGSCFEYGKSFGPCREDDTGVTNSYFVWAKHALYDMGMMLAAKHRASFIWPRFFYVYGPGQRSGSLIPTIAAALRRGERPGIKTPMNANDFVYVDDIAEALALAVRKDIPSGIYNLGSGLATPVWKVCEELELALGHTPVRAGELKAGNVPATASFWADMAKTSSALGWSARTGLSEGIREYVKTLEAEV